MESYLIFLLITTATVMSPGPGVILTLSNTIRYGVSGAVGGILGIACGTFIVAGVSATSLGIILATSSLAFSVMKFFGAAYLIYLGVKLWRAPPVKIESTRATRQKQRWRFFEGLTLQLTNPKAVFFFMSVFPQFVDFSSNYVGCFGLLVTTYSVLVICIHILYACLAKSAKRWLATERGAKAVARVGGGTFVLFGLGLASSNR